MSKRTRTRNQNPNPTTERRRRQRKGWHYGCSYPSDQDEKLFSAQDELAQNFSLEGMEKVAKLCPGITKAKAYPTTGTSTYLLLVKGREGVCPGAETIHWAGVCVYPYLPVGVTLSVVGRLESKSLESFCRRE